MDTVRMNEVPLKLFIYGEEYELFFYKTMYTDGNIAIIVETKQGEPFSTMSVNLPYLNLSDKNIVINHDIYNNEWNKPLLDLFINEFVDKESNFETVKVGYTKSIFVKLKY